MAGLIRAMNNGRANVQELDDAASLRRHVNNLLMFRQSRLTGCGFYAATAHAERLIGAAMIVDPSIRADGVGDTAIIGVNIASGTQISRAATRLRESGNDGVLVGVVLNALIDEWRTESDQWAVAELDELLILSRQEVSGLRKLAQRGEGSVCVALG